MEIIFKIIVTIIFIIVINNRKDNYNYYYNKNYNCAYNNYHYNNMNNYILLLIHPSRQIVYPLFHWEFITHNAHINFPKKERKNKLNH